MHLIVAFLFLSAAPSFAAGQGFVKVQCKDGTVGLVGQRTVLDCHLSAKVSDVTIQVLDWKRKKEIPPVVLYLDGEKKLIPGYELADPSWNSKNFNVSLLISNTTVEHDGEFSIFVATDCGESTSKINLKVKANYSQPKMRSIPEVLVEGGGGKLICESAGGYPKGAVRWFDGDGKEWTRSAKTEVKQTGNGLFQLRSEFQLPGTTYSQFTCIVFNADRVQESEATFISPVSSREFSGKDDGNIPSKVVAPVIVIGSLVVGLLLVLLWLHRRRAQFARRPSTRPLMVDRREVPTDEFNDAEVNPKEMDV